MTVAALVQRERTRLRLAMMARGAAIALALAAAIAAGGTLALGGARWIAVPLAPITLWVVVLASIGAVLVLARREMVSGASDATVARMIESERALRAGSLRGALEVATLGPLGERAASGIARSLASERILAPAMQQRAMTRGLLAAMAGAASILLLAAAGTAAPDGWRAMSHPLLAMRGDLLPPLEILDAPGHILRGETMRIEIAAAERRVIELRSRTTGAPWNTQKLMVSGGRASLTIGPLDADLMLVAADGRSASDTVVVRVTDRPFVGDVSVRATFPAYLRRPAEAVPVGEPARLPRGTSLQIAGRASTTLFGVALVNGGDTLRLESDGHRFGGRMADVRAGRWRWVAHGAAGEIQDVPPPMELEVVQDAPPRAEIVAPARDTVVLPDARVRLYLAATDDHGLSAISLRMVHRRGNGSPQERSELLSTPGVPQWSGEMLLDLAPRALQPGDELAVTLEAADDSPWRQTALSRQLILRVPTLLEQRELARALGDSAVARLERSAREQGRLAQRSEEASRSYDLRRGSDAAQGEARSGGSDRERTASHESAERARALAAEQEALTSQVEDARREATALEQQLRAAGAMDATLQEQLDEVQRLLSEALTAEMQEQLQQLLAATQQLSPEEMRRALEQLAREQQRLREQLERSAQMLRRAALEGAMQTLHDDARDLAERERTTAEALERGERDAPREARELARQSERLSDQVRQLSERLERENAAAGPERMRQAAEQAQRSAQAMERAGQEQSPASDQSAQRRSESAREGAERMEQAAQALERARSEQIGEWKEELTGELDRAVQELSQLAREQQQLADRARGGEDAQEMRPEQSAVQQGVERVGERVQQAGSSTSHVTPHSRGAMAEAQRRVQEATRSAAQQSRPGSSEAAQSMEQASQALERAAAQLARDRDRAARAESSSGFAELLEQMRQMAREQGSINAQASSLLPMPGAGMTEGAEGEARRLGQRQRGLAEQLDAASDADPSGRAAELAREMRQIAEALQRGRLDQQTLDRQQRLFRRLLDAGRTLERDEREDTGKRESRTAEDYELISPARDAAGRPTHRYREPTWSELRDLTPEERRAVLEYFKRINAQDP